MIRSKIAYGTTASRDALMYGAIDLAYASVQKQPGQTFTDAATPAARPTYSTLEVIGGGATGASATEAVSTSGSAPTDPLYGDQWHLAKLGDMEAIWADYTGKGVKVGVYDSGVQYKNPDLAPNYDKSLEIEIMGKHYDGDYRPASGPHGTAVAGLIGAARNGIGGVGVAYDVSLTGVNIFDPYSGGGTKEGIFVNAEDTTLFMEAMHGAARFDVVNHSWGGGPYHGTALDRSSPDNFASDLIDEVSYAAEVGRGGLGTISVVAAGNSRVDVSGQSTATDRHWITVAAYREIDGSSSYYSERGAGLLISAPSSDYAELGGTGMVTTDLVGRDGYNTSDNPGGKENYTDGFGGTSAATPVVSGVVSLMLDANEQLGWRDVQNILAHSAKLPVAFDTGPTFATSTINGQTYALNENRFVIAGQNANWNGGGLHYSTDYGYGAVDALAAVRMSEVWSLFGEAKTSANEAYVTTGVVPVGITALGTGGFDPAKNFIDFTGEYSSFKFTVGDNIDLEHVDLRMTFENGYDIEGFGKIFQTLGTTQFRLIAPDRTSAFVDTLFAFGQASEGEEAFTFGFKNFHNTLSAGEWTFQFMSRYEETFLTVKDIAFDGYGAELSTDSLYTYTNEFAVMAGIEGEAGRTMLRDTDGGTDWINAAAVTSNVTLSLVRGSTTLFGGDSTFTVANGGIENAVTGDGDDNLRGNRIGNHLLGMRGDDMLVGGRGDDTLEGGAGHDTYVFGVRGNSGNDTIVGFTAEDAIAFQRDMGDTLAVGEDGRVLIDGTADGDTVALGVDGPDSLRFLGEADGLWFYGDGGVRPIAGEGQTVLEGTFGNDLLAGSRGSDVFFFDTTGAFGTGADVVNGFGAKDILVTTAAIDSADANGIVRLNPAGFVDLPAEGGTVTFTGTAPTAFELDGTVVHDGQTYFVYSLVGSAVGAADLTF